jgi:hypothetical protein
MSLQHLLRRLLASLAVTLVVASTAAAQPSVSEPEFVPYTNDLQLFDSPDLSRYGNGVRAPQGYFGSAEYLNWSIGAPDKMTVGNENVPNIRVFNPGARTVNTGTQAIVTVTNIITPNVNITTTLTLNINGTNLTTTVAFQTPVTISIVQPELTQTSSVGVTVGNFLTGMGVQQINSLDTGYLGSDFTSGGRFEFGRVVNGRGWLVSTFNMGTQTQLFSGSNVAVNFANPPIGFVDIQGGNIGTPAIGNFNNFRFVGDGFDDDLDGDGVYGRYGRDRGTQQGQTFTNPLDGIPDRENFNTNNPVEVDFDDAVALPTVFRTLETANRTSMYGVETMRIWRLPFSPETGVWEIFAGPRYMNMKDTFNVYGIGVDANPQYFQNPIADMEFGTEVDNNLFGGQLGGRVSYSRDRWAVSFEGRFLAAANFQNIKQAGTIGTQTNTVVPTGPAPLPTATIPFQDEVINMQLGHQFQSSQNTVTWSPMGELRANMKYQVFRSVYVQLGYTAMYADGLARASRVINYTLPDIGIREDRNREGLFVNGVDFGLIINR